MDLEQQLSTMAPPALAALLDLRPEVLWAPVPRDLADLAQRLTDPVAVGAVLRTAPLPVLQLAEALAALGGRATRERLLALLGAEEDHPDARRGGEEFLGWLERRLLVRGEEGSDAVEAPLLAGAFGAPLGAGRPLGVLLPPLTADVLKGYLRELGVPAPRPRTWTKAGALAAATDVLSDPERVRAVAQDAPARVREWLTERAWGPDDDLATRYDQGRWQREQAAVRWAGARGLVVSPTWGYGHEMPAEVALALRGPGYRAPFSPASPPVPTTSVPAEAVEAESASAATAFDATSTAVLDRVRTHGVPTLKSGGVGARELTRLAQLTATTPAAVRLVLELADRLGLLEEDGTRLGPSGALAAWRDAEPGERHAAAVMAWRDVGGVLTRERVDGKAVPALRAEVDCLGCRAGRLALLAALADLPPGAATDAEGVARAALWAHPLVHAGADGEAPFGPSWREGEALGVIARGALAPLGRTLLDADADALVAEAAHLLPGTVDEAIFGADSTAVVTGTPSARVTTLLDACADRESRGAGVVWRLTPGSVRRALDAGTSGEELLAELAAVARTPLPSTTEVLVRDVARRHGSLRVREVASVVRGDDVALLAQAAADRSLRKLGLRLLAPTVLASAAPAGQTVEALRAAGYLPVPEDDAGEVVLPPGARAATAASAGGGTGGSAGGTAAGGAGAGADARPLLVPVTRSPVDVPALAARLVDVGLHAPVAATSSEEVLQRLAPRLPASQVRLLAHALDEGEDVGITYLSGTGGLTQRRITAVALLGTSVRAWCHLREDERHFTVARIQAVWPVD